MPFSTTSKKKTDYQWGWKPWTGGPIQGPQATAPVKLPQITPLSAVGDFGFPQYAEPNWGALIAGDPDYSAAESTMNRANLSDRSSLRDAIRRAVIQSGFAVGQDEDIDAATIAAAQGNQFSTKADIDSQLRRGAAQSDAELAARGILSSGQFGENRSVLQKGADQSTAQATGALADTIAGGRQAYTRSVSDRLGQLQSLKAQIAARLAQNPGIWQQQRPGGGIGDVFAPLGNASAQQMWKAINSSSVRNAPQNQALIRAGYDAFLRNYGSQFGGGAGAAPAAPTSGYTPPPSSNPFPGGIREGTQDGMGNIYRNGRWVRM